MNSPLFSPRPPDSTSFDYPQLLSRHFNFVYIAASLIFLLWNFSPVLGFNLFERFAWILAAFTLNLAVVQGAKHLFYAPRPNPKFPREWKWGRHAHSGFPSGHTVPAFLLAALVWKSAPALGWIWILCAALIAFGRWKAGGHYAWQIALSAPIGFGIGFLATAILLRF